ncbi:hypothetical protein ACSSS7_002446 [Eimeria intestinalis]
MLMLSTPYMALLLRFLSSSCVAFTGSRLSSVYAHHTNAFHLLPRSFSQAGRAAAAGLYTTGCIDIKATLEEEPQQRELTKITAECSSAGVSPDPQANGDRAKSEESETPAKGAATGKKRRGSSNGKANAAPAKKKAAKGSEDESLVPDEEFAALSALATKSRKFVGAHISAAGGVHNALVHCLQVKELLIKMWTLDLLDALCGAPTAINGFKERCEQLQLNKGMQILPHGSYLINVANPDKTKQENAYKALLDDLRRCEQLDIRLYNLHPGICTIAGGMQDSTNAALGGDLGTIF